MEKETKQVLKDLKIWINKKLLNEDGLRGTEICEYIDKILSGEKIYAIKRDKTN